MVVMEEEEQEAEEEEGAVQRGCSFKLHRESSSGSSIVYMDSRGLSWTSWFPWSQVFLCSCRRAARRQCSVTAAWAWTSRWWRY